MTRVAPQKRRSDGRVRISTTLDPVLVDAVDAYLALHAGVDRSTVFDEALSLWLQRRQEWAMEGQFAGEGAPEEEMAAWRAIRRAPSRSV